MSAFTISSARAGALRGWTGVALGVALSGPAAAQAGDGGFRLELAPEASYAPETDQSERYMGVGAGLSGEVWGLGPLGLMFQTGEMASISQIEMTDQGIIPVTTYLFQASVGPTINFELGPLAHVRLGAGPWFGYSWIKRETLDQIDESDAKPDWRQASFMGGQVEGRLDMNLPILSPFASIAGRFQSLGSGEEVTVDADAQGGMDIKGTLGVRLNVLPLVKVSLAGHAGYTRNVIEPVTMTPESLTRYGASFGLVIMK